MWIWRNSDNSIQSFKIFSNHRCPICGQYFRKNEKAICVIPPQAMRINPKFSANLTPHQSCWEAFVGDITDDVILAERYLKHRLPRPKLMSDEESARLNAFKQAAIQQGFAKETAKGYGVRMTRYRSSLYVEYDVYLDHIDVGHRGSRGLFDGLYERQIVANVYNAMHNILQDGKHDKYSVCKVMEEVQNNVNKMFN